MDGLANVADDMKHLKDAVETLQQFFFMNKESHAVYGLQDWSEKMWSESIESFPTGAKILAEQLLLKGDGADGDMPQLLKQRLGEPLSAREWRFVVEFQNRVLNQEQTHEAMIHYLSPPLLSNMLFNREFPLGIEGRVMRDKYRFAVRHSGLHDVKHKTSSATTLLVYSCLGLCTLAFFAYMAYTLTTSGLWEMSNTYLDKTVSKAAS